MRPIISLIIKLIIASLPLVVFLGATRLPDSFFDGIIAINGIFVGLSILLPSIGLHYRISKDQFTDYSKAMVHWYISKRLNDETISVVERDRIVAIRKDEEAINDTSEKLSESLAKGLGNFIPKLISTLLWVYIIIPFIISMILAMGGLLHEGILSFYFGLGAMYSLFFAITNAVWEITYQRTRLDFEPTVGTES